MLRNECLHSKSVNSDMKYYIVHNIAQNLFMREINVFFSGFTIACMRNCKKKKHGRCQLISIYFS